MGEIDPAKLRDYINKKIYKYDSLCIEVIELDDVVGYVEFNDTVVVRINNKNELVDLHIEEITLFETLEEAKKKQVLEIYALQSDRYKPTVLTKSTVEYYRSLIDKNDLDFFLLTVSNYQLQEEEYKKILNEIIEKNPEYLI